MKYVTTKRNVVSMYGSNNIIEVGYCGLQTLLSRETPECYTSGTYGWNADVYDFGDIAICTGYRPFGGIKASYDIVRKYEDKARELFDELFKTGQYWDSTRETFLPLIREFIAEVTK